MPHDPPNDPTVEDRQARQRRLESIVEAAMHRVAAAVAGRAPALKCHFFYGAMSVHPRQLVTWYLFDTDADQQAARESGLAAQIERLTRSELASGGYPAEGFDGLKVAFTTDQDIQRQTGGDYWAYFK